jgi:hypothetical protein
MDLCQKYKYDNETVDSFPQQVLLLGKKFHTQIKSFTPK